MDIPKTLKIEGLLGEIYYEFFKTMKEAPSASEALKLYGILEEDEHNWMVMCTKEIGGSLKADTILNISPEISKFYDMINHILLGAHLHARGLLTIPKSKEVVH